MFRDTRLQRDSDGSERRYSDIQTRTRANGQCFWHRNGEEQSRGHQLSDNVFCQLYAGHAGHAHRFRGSKFDIWRMERRVFRDGCLQRDSERCGCPGCDVQSRVCADRQRFWHGNGNEQSRGNQLSRDLFCSLAAKCAGHAHGDSWHKGYFFRVVGRVHGSCELQFDAHFRDFCRCDIYGSGQFASIESHHHLCARESLV